MRTVPGWVMGAALAAALLAPAFAAPARTPAPAPLAASRAMLARLEASGRATAAVEHEQPDPLGDGTRRQRGTIAIEPPDRTRLDFASGESVTLRSDGGEWLQPALGQMLRLSAGHAENARRWWSLLLPEAGERFTETRIGPARYLVIAAGGDPADTAWVTLGPGGLPARLRFRGVDGEFVDVRFSGWSFAKPRGPAAFRIEPPAGVETVELP